MSKPTDAEAHALRLLVLASLEAIAAAGPAGIPAGLLYAVLMTQGCTLNQFESLMAALVTTGKVRKQGQVYSIAL